MSTAAEVLDAIGPEQIRAAFTTAIDTTSGHAADLAGIAGVLGEAADRYETLQMVESTLGHLRDGAAALTTAAGALGAAGERLQAALTDFNAHDGHIGDTVAEVGNLMRPEGYTTTFTLTGAQQTMSPDADTSTPAQSDPVDIGPGGLFLGDVNAGAVTWTGTGPAGGRTVQVDADGEFAEVGLTRPQMRQLRDQLAATLAGDAAAEPQLVANAGSVSWRPEGTGHRLRLDNGDQHAEVVLTDAQLRAVQQQLAADLAAEAAAAATFPGVTGRLDDKPAGQILDNDAQLRLPDGALPDDQAADCSRAVRLYRNSTYRPIAAYLRDGEDQILPIRERFDQHEPSLEPISQHVAQIDQAMQAAPLDQPIELWRGVRDLPEVLGRGLDNDMTGTQWTEPSFTSTSVDPKVALLFADDVLLRLRVPAGVGAIQLDSRPTDREHNREAEVLLQRGLQMQVVAEGHEDIGGGAYWSGGQMHTAPPRRYRVLNVEVTMPDTPNTPEPAPPSRPAPLARSSEPIRAPKRR